jgi:hypothetical protein
VTVTPVFCVYSYNIDLELQRSENLNVTGQQSDFPFLLL